MLLQKSNYPTIRHIQAVDGKEEGRGLNASVNATLGFPQGRFSDLVCLHLGLLTTLSYKPTCLQIASRFNWTRYIKKIYISEHFPTAYERR